MALAGNDLVEYSSASNPIRAKLPDWGGGCGVGVSVCESMCV